MKLKRKGYFVPDKDALKQHSTIYEDVEPNDSLEKEED